MVLLNNYKIKLNLTEISTLYSTYGKETIKTCDADDYGRLWNKPPLLAFLATSRTSPPCTYRTTIDHKHFIDY